MRQLVLLLALVAVLAGASANTAANEFEVPCDDDGLAHIPDLPEGARRPYSVRKRSRTVHRDPEVTDDTPKLPPGQRRFDAVLPDEQGSDINSSTPTRGQRQLSRTTTSAADDNDGNEVPEQPEPLRRASRRPAYPKKVAVPRARKLAVVEAAEAENYPVGHPGLRDPKQDAVVDSYEAVRKYPTHLPYDDDAEALQDDNDVVRATRPADQLAQEDFSTELLLDANAADPHSDPDLPSGYRSKFPARTFASDAGGSGDVLRIKPRKRVNQYHQDGAHGAHAAAEAADAAAAPTPSSPTPSPERRRQPARRPVAHEEQTQQPPRRGGPGTHRQQHLVSTEEPATFPSRRRQDGDALTEANVDAEPNDVQTPSPRPRRPLRRRPRPRPAPAQDDAEAGGDSATEQQRPQQHAVLRRRRPQPQSVSATGADENVLENAVTPEQQADVQPRRRPLRRRPRPRPTPSVAADEKVDGDVDSNAIVSQTTVEPEPRRQPSPRRRPRPGPTPVVAGEDQDEDAHRSRGHGRRLSVGPAPAENLPVVHVEHDGTAAEKKAHEPTLVRSAVKKAPAGGGAGNPSPALIQKIVKNTLRRLKPQIAEHEGDVGVDILVKIIQVDE